jgi:acylaminoacyl-peptidase
MMMVGLEEVRAPPWESEQYFKALKLRGVETVLVHFPDEPHGIRIHPSHHMEKVLTILAWFQRYPR